MSRRFWTHAEDELLRNKYRELGCKFCAIKLKRTQRAIYVRARALGLAEKSNWLTDAEILSAIRRCHTLGWTDSETARWLEKTRKVQVDRHRVGELRKSLKLGSNAHSNHRRREVAAKTRQQLNSAGLTSLGEYRLDRWRRIKEQLGWPDALTMQATIALEVFWNLGPGVPISRVQLCKLMGVSSTKRTAPTSNAPGGTVLAELARAGFITRAPRRLSVERADKSSARISNSKVDLYYLNNGVSPSEQRNITKPIIGSDEDSRPNDVAIGS